MIRGQASRDPIKGASDTRARCPQASLVLWACLSLLIVPDAYGAKASWYDSASVKKEGTCHAEKCYTASGLEIHELERRGIYFCAAARTYRMGSLLKVTNLENGKSVNVRVVDRGGFKKYGRVLDLSKKSFASISDPRKGVIDVSIQSLS